MTKYELTVVMDGKATAAKKKAFLTTLEKILGILKGKLEKTDDWGVKDLTYMMGKSTTGSFTHFLLDLEPTSIKALNLKLKMEPEVIRYLLIKK